MQMPRSDSVSEPPCKRTRCSRGERWRPAVNADDNNLGLALRDDPSVLTVPEQPPGECRSAKHVDTTSGPAAGRGSNAATSSEVSPNEIFSPVAPEPARKAWPSLDHVTPRPQRPAPSSSESETVSGQSHAGSASVSDTDADACSDTESACSVRARAGSDSDGPEEPLRVECRLGLGGHLLGDVRIDRDATVGQFKRRLLDLLLTSDAETTLEWFKNRKFVMSVQTYDYTCGFDDDYFRFTCCKPLRDTKRVRGMLLRCSIITMDGSAGNHSPLL